MGRAYEVRKASIQKTGAAKAKIYSMYAREIYEAVKKSGPEPTANVTLRRLIEGAKKDQVPSDIIKRAIDKVNSGADESYTKVVYELFGPSGSNLMVECLTDNVNRTLSFIRPALNKNNGKMGLTGSVSYMYDNLSIVSFKGLSEDKVLETLIDNNIEIDDMETSDGSVIVYGKPQDLYDIKDAITKVLPNIEFEVEEITMLPKAKVTLTGEDLEYFQRMLKMIDEIEDVQNIYHNVEL
jgi:YebC/PmpR family DNA-binding regulatory protein